MDAVAMDVTLDALLAECARLQASDLHLAPGQPPYFRVNGDLAPHAGVPPLGAEAVAALCARLMKGSGTRGLETTGSQDGALSGPNGTRFRFNVYRRLGGMSAAVRLLEGRITDATALGATRNPALVRDRVVLSRRAMAQRVGR